MNIVWCLFYCCNAYSNWNANTGTIIGGMMPVLFILNVPEEITKEELEKKFLDIQVGVEFTDEKMEFGKFQLLPDHVWSVFGPPEIHNIAVWDLVKDQEKFWDWAVTSYPDRCSFSELVKYIKNPPQLPLTGEVK